MIMADNKQNKNPNVPNLSFKREQSESCFDSAERVINQKQNVPNLRFPEFTGEYEKYNLGELGSTLIGLTYSPADVVSEGGTIVLRSSNIKNGVTNYDDIVRVNKKIKDSIITRTNDILVCARNGSPRLIGKNAILKESDSNITFGAFMMIYRSNDNTYIHQLLSTKRFYSQVGENLGARINQITTSDFNSFEFYFPKSKEERIKIASLLALIDKRIETQNKIIEDLKKLKVAIIENAFCGKHYNYKIGDIITQISNRNKSNKETNVLSVSNKLGFVEQSEQFEDRTVASEDVTNYKIVRTNDFAYNPARINVGSIARLKQYESGIVSPMYICFHAKKNVLPEYLEMFFLTQYFKHEMYKRLEGSVRLCLSFEGLTNIPISIPEIPLQKEISEKILAFETKIGIEEHYLNALEKQKQYLLQQMFI